METKKVLKYALPLMAGCLVLAGCADSVPIREMVYNKMERLDGSYTEIIENKRITVSIDESRANNFSNSGSLGVKIENLDTGNTLKLVDLEDWSSITYKSSFKSVDEAYINGNRREILDAEEKFDKVLEKIFHGLDQKIRDIERETQEVLDDVKLD